MVGDDKLHFEKFMEKHGLSVNTETLKLLMSYGYEYDRLVAKAKIEVPAR